MKIRIEGIRKPIGARVTFSQLTAEERKYIEEKHLGGIKTERRKKIVVLCDVDFTTPNRWTFIPRWIERSYKLDLPDGKKIIATFPEYIKARANR